MNKKSLEALILSGAFDRFGERASLYASIPSMIEHAKEAQQKTHS
jgi:DNA polymerase III alpha subunit